jgi:hypothetical protein
MVFAGLMPVNISCPVLAIGGCEVSIQYGGYFSFTRAHVEAHRHTCTGGYGVRVRVRWCLLPKC